MAINALGIKEAIRTELSSLSEENVYDSLAVHTAWADGIRNYITANLKITGNYIGMTNINPLLSDPLNGEYVWGVSTFELSGEVLRNQIHGLSTTGFNVWVFEIESAIQEIQFIGLDETEKITAQLLLPLEDFVFNISKEDLTVSEDVSDGITILAQKLYESIVGLDVSEKIAQATSTTPGTGSIVYTGVS